VLDAMITTWEPTLREACGIPPDAFTRAIRPPSRPEDYEDPLLDENRRLDIEGDSGTEGSGVTIGSRDGAGSTDARADSGIAIDMDDTDAAIATEKAFGEITAQRVGVVAAPPGAIATPRLPPRPEPQDPTSTSSQQGGAFPPRRSSLSTNRPSAATDVAAAAAQIQTQAQQQAAKVVKRKPAPSQVVEATAAATEVGPAAPEPQSQPQPLPLPRASAGLLPAAETTDAPPRYSTVFGPASRNA
jgi:hypothetical protein